MYLALYYTHKPGGLCKRLYRLFDALGKADEGLCYLTLDPDELKIHAASLLRHESFTVKKIPFPFKKRKGLLFWALFTLWCPLYAALAAYRVKPKGYIVFGAYYSAMFSPAKLLHKAPLTLFIRSLVFKIDKLTKKSAVVRYVSGIVERFGIRQAERVICMTEAMRRELENYVGSSLHDYKILINDIPKASEVITTELILPEAINKLIEDSALCCLTAGVIDERKNIGFLLDTWELLEKAERRKDCLLLIAGAGPLEKVYRDEVIKRGLSKVIFLGWINSLEELLLKTDLLLHPSLHEGVSNVVLEAISKGTPVLVSDIPEHQELPGFEELLFNISDSEGLASKLLDFACDNSNLAKLQPALKDSRAALSFNWEDKALKLLLKI